jgi:hypothetical protein
MVHSPAAGRPGRLSSSPTAALLLLGLLLRLGSGGCRAEGRARRCRRCAPPQRAPARDDAVRRPAPAPQLPLHHLPARPAAAGSPAASAASTCAAGAAAGLDARVAQKAVVPDARREANSRGPLPVTFPPAAAPAGCDPVAWGRARIQGAIERMVEQVGWLGGGEPPRGAGRAQGFARRLSVIRLPCTPAMRSSRPPQGFCYCHHHAPWWKPGPGVRDTCEPACVGARALPKQGVDCRCARATLPPCCCSLLVLCPVPAIPPRPPQAPTQQLCFYLLPLPQILPPQHPFFPLLQPRLPSPSLPSSYPPSTCSSYPTPSHPLLPPSTYSSYLYNLAFGQRFATPVGEQACKPGTAPGVMLPYTNQQQELFQPGVCGGGGQSRGRQTRVAGGGHPFADSCPPTNTLLCGRLCTLKATSCS